MRFYLRLGPGTPSKFSTYTNQAQLKYALVKCWEGNSYSAVSKGHEEFIVDNIHDTPICIWFAMAIARVLLWPVVVEPLLGLLRS